MAITRREFTLMSLMMLAGALPVARAQSVKVTVVLAPSNLGLRPEGGQPGTWQAPQALIDAGLQEAVQATQVVRLDRPQYESGAQKGTRIRNGQTIRAFSMQLSHVVQAIIAAGEFPLVIGGDCSVLLGGLYGLRLAGGRGLVHIDGHNDFYHPANYDVNSRLGSAAGMDLALASGRGEALLTEWPHVSGPLARDAEIVQVGERDSANTGKHIVGTGIAQFTVQRALREGIEATAERTVAQLAAQKLDRAWLHVDLDVLDERVMPAVDSPGRPGFNFDQLAAFVGALCASKRIAGADFAIYDPDRDPQAKFAAPLVRCIASGIRSISA